MHGKPFYLTRRTVKAVLGFFSIPADNKAYLAELDEFIEREIKPLERKNDNSC